MIGVNFEKAEANHGSVSRVSNLPSAEDINIGVAATKSTNAEVQRVMEDTENEVAQRPGRKRKVYNA